MGISLGILAAVVNVWAFSIYIYDTVYGKNRPHLFSWIPWTIFVGVGFLAQLRNEAGFGALVTGITLIGHTVVCFLGIKYGEKKITFSDKIALYSALSIIPLWALTQNDVLAVILASCIDVISLFPTLRKSYMKPFEENVSSKFIASSKDLLSLFSIEKFIFVNVFYVLTIGISTFLSGMFIVTRRYILSRK